jgi:hypothetical protein
MMTRFESKGIWMISNYVARWSEAQRDQFELAAAVDVIAERFPLYDPDGLAAVAEKLDSVLARVHRFEEDEVFPALEAMSPQIGALLATFRSHHARDAESAGSICQILRDAPTLNIDQLKHAKSLLISFAETLRRHAQFEEAITMALFASKRVDERRAIQ